jgi:transcription antitermination factor NusG
MRPIFSPISTRARRGRRSAASLGSSASTGDAPSRCPESEILKLKAAEVDGVVRLASAPAPSRYRPSMGEQVRIRFGPLEGREGRYAGPRRNLAQVLVSLLGRQVVVLVAADAIEAKAG